MNRTASRSSCGLPAYSACSRRSTNSDRFASPVSAVVERAPRQLLLQRRRGRSRRASSRRCPFTAGSSSRLVRPALDASGSCRRWCRQRTSIVPSAAPGVAARSAGTGRTTHSRSSGWTSSTSCVPASASGAWPSTSSTDGVWYRIVPSRVEHGDHVGRVRQQRPVRRVGGACRAALRRERGTGGTYASLRSIGGSARRLRRALPVATLLAVLGGIPERSKGTGCKPVGSAFAGSNPAPTTFRSIDPIRRAIRPRCGCYSSSRRLAFARHEPAELETAVAMTPIAVRPTHCTSSQAIAPDFTADAPARM